MKKALSHLLLLVMVATLIQPVFLSSKAYAATPDATLKPVLDKYEDLSGVYKDGDKVNLPRTNFVGYYKDQGGDLGEATTVAKFDLSGVNDAKQIQKAELFIYVNYIEISNMHQGHPFFIKLYGSSQDSWSDSARGIPAISDPPIANYDQSRFAAHGWTAFDVTNFVKSQTPDNAATFVFTGNPAADMNLGASGKVASNIGFYDSSYTTDSNLVPRLEITYSLNSPPIDISLSNLSVAENSAVGTTIGNLAAIDVDAGDTFTYSVGPAGDNSNFTISGNELKTAAIFDYETKSGYNVEIKATDSAGNTLTKPFPIQVTNVNDPPTGSITINAGQSVTNSPVVTLNVTAADPEHDGVQMQFSNDNAVWTAWEAAEPTISKTWTLTAGDGDKSVYMRLRDSSGLSAAIASDTIVLDTTAPTGTLSINSDADKTNSASVTLNILNNDANPSVEMRFSNDNSAWGSWEPAAATKSWALTSADGEKTVHMQLRDAAGNVASFSDTIELDTTPATITGVMDGQITNTDVVISFNEGTATLNGSAFASGGTVSVQGSHTLAVTDDAGNGITVHFTIDKIAPTGTLNINSGAAYTNTTSVTLNITNTGAAEMRFSNDRVDWSAWAAVAATSSITVPTGDEAKTVYMQLKDAAGNTAEYNATIVLDTTAPAVAGVTEGQITNTDVVVSFNEGTATLNGASFASGGTVSVEDNHTLVVTDQAGNVATIHFTIDKTAPTGTLTINNGAAQTNATSVTLNITNTGAAEMRFSNDRVDWSAWAAVAATSSITVPTGDGAKTVYMQLKDTAGNTAEYNATIVLDTTPPAVTGVTDGQITNTDVVVSFNEGTATLNGAAFASGGTVRVEGNHTLVVTDQAGNVATIHFTIDKTLPTGTVSINNGAAKTNDTNVNLTLTSNDAHAVEMRLSNDNSSWGAWEPASATKSLTLTPGDGVKTAYVQLRDAAGNIADISDTIELDTTPPDITGIAEGEITNTDVTISFPEGTATLNGSVFTSGQTVTSDGKYTLVVTDTLGNNATRHFSIDKTAPTGTITINNGAASTFDRNVRLSLTGDDGAGSGVKEMRFSNDNTTWSAWKPFAATENWTLPAYSAQKVVYMQLKDNVGNASSSFSDSIQLWWRSSSDDNGGNNGNNGGNNGNNGGNNGNAGGNDGRQQITVKQTNTTEDGQTVVTVEPDTAQLEQQLSKAGPSPTFIIPVTTEADKLVVTLNGQTAKHFADKDALIEIHTPLGNYQLPANQIRIDELQQQFGSQVSLSDITISVIVSKSANAIVQAIDRNAAEQHYTRLSPPVDFIILATYHGIVRNVGTFGTYVARELLIPDDVDPDKVTTAVVLNTDGTVRHVPTFVGSKDGKNYAVVQSLTNSTYFLISNDRTFADVKEHRAAPAIHDLASRLIINGVSDNQFSPEASISRAEFAAIAIRALGLPSDGQTSAYHDVTSGDWFVGAVGKAQEYGIIAGYEDQSFRPANTITRQEALVILSRIMKIVNMNTNITEQQINIAVMTFADRENIGAWAKEAIALAQRNHVLEDADTGMVLTGNITRAETAVLVQRLLNQANLIHSEVN